MDVVASSIGGVIIGASAGALWLLHGRVAGISGISGALVNNSSKDGSDTLWRTAFLSGLAAGGAAMYWLYPAAFAPDKTTTRLSNLPLMACAGALVGYGTQLGSGCTSGHGVCGLSRFSLRSLAATLTFMGSGAVTAYVARKLSESPSPLSASFWSSLASAAVKSMAPVDNSSLASLRTPLALAASTFASMALAAHLSRRYRSATVAHLSAALPGFGFAVGVGLSGMTNQAKVLAFLDVTGKNWDPSLAFVMGGALLANTAIYQISRRLHRPYLEECIDCGFATPTATEVTPELIVGSAVFGVGWGLAGYCPAPGIFRSAELLFEPRNALPVVTWLGSMLIGMRAHQLLPVKFS